MDMVLNYRGSAPTIIQNRNHIFPIHREQYTTAVSGKDRFEYRPVSSRYRSVLQGEPPAYFIKVGHDRFRPHPLSTFFVLVLTLC
jgi:hypothetical protein